MLIQNLFVFICNPSLVEVFKSSPESFVVVPSKFIFIPVDVASNPLCASNLTSSLSSVPLRRPNETVVDESTSILEAPIFLIVIHRGQYL